MVITDIVRTKRGRFSVYINHEYSGVLHGDIYIMSHIRIGEQITPELITDLIYQSEIIIAKERALKLLSARSYTKKKLKDKLLNYVDEPAADIVIARMEDLGLINDSDYAIRYAKDCINLKGFSHKRTISALYERGIGKEIIATTMEDLGAEDSQKLIVRLVFKKYINKLEDENDRRRTINGLLRRGFDYNSIKTVVDNLIIDINYYENDREE